MLRTVLNVSRRDFRPTASARFVFLAAFIGIMTLGGCKAELSADLQIDAAGAGKVTVTLYVDSELADAARKIAGRPLLSMIDLEPLTSTGWVFESGGDSSRSPRWSVESLTISRQINSPADLSPVVGSLTAGGVRLFDPLALEVRDEPHKVSYRLSGAIRLPALEEVLPPVPKSLTETASIGATDSPMKTLRLVLTVSLPGKVSLYDGEQGLRDLTWHVLPGERRSVTLESEVIKAKRLALWSIGGVFATIAVATYIAARRRSASTSLST